MNHPNVNAQATAELDQTAVRDPHECPACSNIAGNAATADRNDVDTCTGCGAIFTTRRIYLGDSYQYAKAFWFKGTDPPPEQWVYFDLDVLGSEGIGRRHGWIDRETKLILQAG